ncbi:cupin domain-containing protein [Dyella psychrodurans]|uniref:Cupin domain-containing protein n=1 Tax=Dyella psychrodurans TaxID=1927960 RepID=A0A370XDB6_9GAMM|nr:AraC family ligand binding domain-containing protein [Dyella psychrodurans]RDS86211.1 cupin domain-containing protein [Dyella psychrodurans]
MSNAIRRLDSDRMFVSTIERFEKYEFSDDRHSVRIILTTGKAATLEAEASHYVVVCDGEFQVSLKNATHHLSEGCFGSFPGVTQIKGEGRAFVLSSLGYRSPLLAGGPAEEQGRLRYVDGCTTSLLLPPPVRGEPCLNFMHLPRNVSQTMHTHPSLRAGIILSGNGQCKTKKGVLGFHPGTTFFIPPYLPHSFQSNDETLRIAIFHPDSDSGPTHTNHTMLNRTFVGGKSAQFITKLHTTDGAQQ